MSSRPPPPPPPPPPRVPLPRDNRPSGEEQKGDRCDDFVVCTWAARHRVLQESCIQNEICLYSPPYRFHYKDFPFIIQIGPTCGLVALSMLTKGRVIPDDILQLSRIYGFSKNGEMFSVKSMMHLSVKVLCMAEIRNVNITLCKGNLYSHEIIDKLLKGAVMLVPYDADFNHRPCLKEGHKAHWALLCGIVITQDIGANYKSNPDKVYVFCKHGKSRYLGAWKLSDLAASNANLVEFSPTRGEDGLRYILPEGGIGGPDGLMNQFLMFEGF